MTPSILTASFRLALVGAFAASSFAQQPVAAGKGSYASTPPPGQMVDKKKGVDPVDEVEKRTLYLVKDEGRPIPSNEWFQNLIFKQYGTGLWAMPHRVDATPEGIEIFHSTTFSGDGVRAIAEWPLAELGRVDWTAHGSTPTSMVYANAAKKTRTLIAWNPTAQPQTVQFFEGIKPIGKLAVAPRSIASASLAPSRCLTGK